MKVSEPLLPFTTLSVPVPALVTMMARDKCVGLTQRDGDDLQRLHVSQYHSNLVPEVV